MVHGTLSYEIHDNGGRPYVVDVFSNHIVILRLHNNGSRGEVIYETDYEKIRIGDNLLSIPRYAPRGDGKGNSILLKCGPHAYLYIGSEIYEFEIRGDEIIEYYSPIGNSDVPYPYAIGQEYTYFFLDKKRVLTSLVDRSKDGYDQFYQVIPDDQKKEFTVRMIAEPIYDDES